MSEKKRTPFYILMIAALVIAASIVLYNRRDLKIPEFSLKPSGRTPDNQVGCLLVAKVGERHLRMGFVMPAANREDRDDLLQKLPVIKHDLLMSANHPDLVHSLELRDFDAIRNHVLRTVNHHIKRPVDQVFFESYYFD